MNFDEEAFQNWYKRTANQIRINPDPDDPGHFYDYRAAFMGGARPDPKADLHWPSKFKRFGHPRLFVGGRDTRTGEELEAPGLSSVMELLRKIAGGME